MGWFKVDRSIKDHWLWKDNEPFDKRSAWIDLIMMANIKDFKTHYKGKLVMRKRGDVNTSTRFLAERWGWSRNKVIRFLRLLESDEMVSLHGTTDGTTITVENYSKFQDVRTTNGATHEATDGTTDEATHGTNDKNLKNIKNTKTLKERVGTYPEEVREAFREFKEMRVRMKKPMTDGAVSRFFNKLDKLAAPYGVFEEDLAVRIINQSVDRGWSSIYDLKEDNNGFNGMGSRTEMDMGSDGYGAPDGDEEYLGGIPPASAEYFRSLRESAGEAKA